MNLTKERILNLTLRLLPILVFLGLAMLPVVAGAGPPNGGDAAWTGVET